MLRGFCCWVNRRQTTSVFMLKEIISSQATVVATAKHAELGSLQPEEVEAFLQPTKEESDSDIKEELVLESSNDKGRGMIKQQHCCSCLMIGWQLLH